MLKVALDIDPVAGLGQKWLVDKFNAKVGRRERLEPLRAASPARARTGVAASL